MVSFLFYCVEMICGKSPNECPTHIINNDSLFATLIEFEYAAHKNKFPLVHA